MARRSFVALLQKFPNQFVLLTCTGMQKLRGSSSTVRMGFATFCRDRDDAAKHLKVFRQETARPSKSTRIRKYFLYTRYFNSYPTLGMRSCLGWSALLELAL